MEGRLPDIDKGRLAATVRRLRGERGWSQEDLARGMADVGQSWQPSTVARTERAVREPRYTQVLAVARALGASLEELLGLAQEHPGQDAGAGGELRQLEQERPTRGLSVGASSVIGRLHHIVWDCPDPHLLAKFYSALLGNRLPTEAMTFASLRSTTMHQAWGSGGLPTIGRRRGPALDRVNRST